MSSTLMKTAEALVAHCRNGTEAEGLNTLYHPDCVSVEAMGMGGGPREFSGLDAIRGKHDYWNATNEVTGGSVDGPFPHGDDRFAVIFDMSGREKATGKEFAMREVAVYHVDPAGKITREEFFYGA
jgi:ketosteroid isomerase-like protein